MGNYGLEGVVTSSGVRRRVGISRRVENSVGCLSENRLFISRGNNVPEHLANSTRPAYISPRHKGIPLQLLTVL